MERQKQLETGALICGYGWPHSQDLAQLSPNHQGDLLKAMASALPQMPDGRA